MKSIIQRTGPDCEPHPDNPRHRSKFQEESSHNYETRDSMSTSSASFARRPYINNKLSIESHETPKSDSVSEFTFLRTSQRASINLLKRSTRGDHHRIQLQT
ncbi:hypothetical protein X777_05522 [Ooceraea biroi]|uniref:Uncharacterized protein n=1 Tax=Ooceraea biroi TaxID=2015173 RepID=A0A026WF09_OOCBI|nr:hypothetical protein X777_05522 [Ooceraea biroi]